MKNTFSCSLFFLLVSLNVFAVQAQKPKMLWSVNTGLEQPESVCYDAQTQAIYVSNISGSPTEKDGKGWISRISKDGKAMEAKWFTEVDAPKGLAVYGGTLWVADIDRVLSVDIATKKKTVYDVAGAKFLNDVAVGKDGTVYISDMVTNKIHRIAKGKLDLFKEGKDLESPNGLLVEEPYLRVASWGKDMNADFATKVPGSLFNINLQTKKKSTILDPSGNFDGVQYAGKKLQGFVISDWVKGTVYVTGKSRKPKVLLDGLKNPADIGMISETSVLLVPEMSLNKLTAYQL